MIARLEPGETPDGHGVLVEIDGATVRGVLQDELTLETGSAVAAWISRSESGPRSPASPGEPGGRVTTHCYGPAQEEPAWRMVGAGDAYR